MASNTMWAKQAQTMLRTKPSNRPGNDSKSSKALQNTKKWSASRFCSKMPQSLLLCGVRNSLNVFFAGAAVRLTRKLVLLRKMHMHRLLPQSGCERRRSLGLWTAHFVSHPAQQTPSNSIICFALPMTEKHGHSATYIVATPRVLGWKRT